MAAASQFTTRLPTPAVTEEMVGLPGGAALGVPLASVEAGPSAAPVRVAITDTVVAVPGVKPVMV